MLFKRLITLLVVCVLIFNFSSCIPQQIQPDPTHPSTDSTTELSTDLTTEPSTDLTTEPSTDSATEPPSDQSEETLPNIHYEPHTCPEEDPYINVDKESFYSDYEPACCNQDAINRSKHGLLSGLLDVPEQYVQEAANRPQADGKFVRNTAALYLDNGNTYVIFDSKGNEILRIHKAGGYITLEEVAAYMYAFGGSDGCFPANYVSKKLNNIGMSPWGEYVRGNHSRFIGNTNKYPYEPELPNISGCGGTLQYFEMDIGTTGTVTEGHSARPYVQNGKITRGAARLVYAREDLNGNGIYEINEIYVFYTHNHYNDFREYLNYYGGWGEVFGNETGGGKLSSDTDANPTPYIPTAYEDFSLWVDKAS